MKFLQCIVFLSAAIILYAASGATGDGPANNSLDLQAGPYEFLVYYWRGVHDFMYCACRSNAIVHCGWQYAWE